MLLQGSRLYAVLLATGPCASLKPSVWSPNFVAPPWQTHSLDALCFCAFSCCIPCLKTVGFQYSGLGCPSSPLGHPSVWQDPLWPRSDVPLVACRPGSGFWDPRRSCLHLAAVTVPCGFGQFPWHPFEASYFTVVTGSAVA